MIAHAGFKDHDAVSQVPDLGVVLSDPTAPRPRVNVFALHSPRVVIRPPHVPGLTASPVVIRQTRGHPGVAPWARS